MISNALRAQVIKYVRERHCREQGGFCFYRLEEPSGADTFYALWVLNALNEPFSDENTVSYLERLQLPDGSYESIFSAFYSIKALQLLNRRPLYDASHYIEGKMAEYDIHAENMPAEITSVFKQLLFLMELYDSAGTSRSPALEGRIQRILLQFQNKDGGFGYINSSLDETAKALRILQGVDPDFDNSKTRNFIMDCETPDFGFTDVPGTSLSYIEHICAGLNASHLASCRPRYLNACSLFISGCRRRNGGFSRAISDGIATLENTYFAVHSLLLISHLRRFDRE